MKSISRHRVLGLSAALLFFLGQASFAKTLVVYVGSGGDNFSPKTITIEPGDKIEWNWDSSFHSTTSGTPGNPSGMWDSGVHQTGYKYTYEFNNAGSFPYYCSVHGGCCTMTGTVNVSMPSPSPIPIAFPLTVTVTVAVAIALPVSFAEPESVSDSQPYSQPEPFAGSAPSSRLQGPDPGGTANDRQRPDRA